MINLDRLDKQSATWEKLVLQIKKRIEDLRTQLEHGNPSETDEIVRGRIKELRGILLAGEEAPIQVPYDPMHY